MVDPERDTSAVIKKYLRSILNWKPEKLDGTWHGGEGDSEVEKVVETYRELERLDRELTSDEAQKVHFDVQPSS